MKKLLHFAAASLVPFAVGAVAYGQHYTEVNLVANVSGAAPVTDAKLVNPWGISRTAAGAWWVSDNVTGFSTLYNGAGMVNPLIVTIPVSPNNKTTKIGSPTGTISNSSAADFVLSNGVAAQFLFATIDGTIAAWNPTIALADGAAPPSTHAVTVAATKDGSVYTGITSATVEGTRFLYLANNSLKRIDVYDNSFHIVHLDGAHPAPGNAAFADAELPAGYSPFNVQNIGNDIVVTYALQVEGNPRPMAGPGFGRVDIFTSAGQLLRRLDNGDQLNVPWAVTLAPNDFGTFSHALLIGQFANAGATPNSGVIAAYDLASGHFLGLLEDASGAPIAINGLWGLSFGNASGPGNYDPAGAPSEELYFAAGVHGETQGLFGYLKAVPAEQTQGNDQ
ncbi:TIGR03118 family protein [Granulicella sp. dw_53]|uniref:TIGR03118 family protein n=1 Tax=Granulicella sp. dw_53 TaxID=2719792 RepID=UPI001BD68DB2|nr:TIGR03118 family protein [Granulicella sp. dw_53]